MKRIIISLVIFSSSFGFTSCIDREFVDGRVISTETIGFEKGGKPIGGFRSVMRTSDRYTNKVTIKDSNDSIRSFEIETLGSPFSNDLIGDSVRIGKTIDGYWQLGKVIVLW